MAYDWKITLKKGLIVAILGAVTSLIAWLGAIPVDSSTTIYITSGIMVLTMIKNALEHIN